MDNILSMTYACGARGLIVSPSRVPNVWLARLRHDGVRIQLYRIVSLCE